VSSLAVSYLNLTPTNEHRAWPIGVTMVGIHERSAREKLHESGKGQAHIMSDEVTRKFLQSIKRCLSFAQTRWPPEDQLQLMG
jgi:pre-mRNA-splicing factor 18